MMIIAALCRSCVPIQSSFLMEPQGQISAKERWVRESQVCMKGGMEGDELWMGFCFAGCMGTTNVCALDAPPIYRWETMDVHGALLAFHVYSVVALY